MVLCPLPLMLGNLGMVIAKANPVPTYRARLSVGQYRGMSILLDKGNESVLDLSPFYTPFSYLIILGQFFSPLYLHTYDTLSHFITFSPHFTPLSILLTNWLFHILSADNVRSLCKDVFPSPCVCTTCEDIIFIFTSLFQ
jgi:hypothetical protein